MSILNTLQIRFKQANIVEKLLYINLAVFLLVFVFNTLGFLFQSNTNFIVNWFTLPASFDEFIQKPWTLITYGFVHVSFIHVLSNSIALFFIGNLFTDYFTAKQLITFYLFGTAFGGLIFLLSYTYFPVFSQDVSNSLLLGASAGVSSVFIGIATYIPNYQFKIRLIGYLKLWYLAAFWMVLDVIQIPGNNSGGHLAHIGGAVFGFLYVSLASNTEVLVWEKIRAFFKPKKKPLKTVYKTKKTTAKRSGTKSTTNANQQQINHILEKISKSGYDALSKEEKAFLFKQGTH